MFKARPTPIHHLLALLLLVSCSFHVTAAATTDFPEATVIHEMDVALSPSKNLIHVSDTIIFKEPLPDNEIAFILNTQLKIDVSDGRMISMTPITSTPNVTLYRVALANNKNTLTIKYSGKIADTPQQVGSEIREFQQSSGVISEKGVLLSGISHWYPQFRAERLAFSLDLQLPKGWKGVSQGKKVHESSTISGIHERWQSLTPQEEIYLVAAPFTEYRGNSGHIEISVFLRSDDKQLAQRYIESTASYLKLYQELIGPYPYSKFSIVENFWQTGYGMPSFTLLGDRVIRLPFILYTSLPHEIVHNWWGNGVFINPEHGNWSEGLTSYLADHMIKEQKGEGSDYRRELLKRYTDFAANDSDELALQHFRGRTSAASEAIGYGKTLMFFHMLRKQMGDYVFMDALQRFYQSYLFKKASFHDLVQFMGEVSGKNFAFEYQQWVIRSGAPQLDMENVSQIKTSDGGYRVKFTLNQIQNSKAYHLDVPITVTLRGEDTPYKTVVTMQKKSLQVEIPLPKEPLSIGVDQGFDLFRRLDTSEVPASLGQLLNSKQMLFILPKKLRSSESKELYVSLTQHWKRFTPDIEVAYDDELKTLPIDRNIVLIGWGNRFSSELSDKVKIPSLSNWGKNDFTLDDQRILIPSDDVLISIKPQQNRDQVIGVFAISGKTNLANLLRRLPHYMRYSYLAFSPNKGNGRAYLRGQWKNSYSDLHQEISPDNAQTNNASVVIYNESRPLSDQIFELSY